MRQALEKPARDLRQGRRPGAKAVKTIRGVSDSFHRLRAGEYRVTCDAIDEDRVVLVLGIVQRGDLERWIRNR